MERIRDWLDEKNISAGKIAAFAAVVPITALLSAYMVLCIQVQRGDRLLPGTVVVNSQGEAVADLGKLTRQEAVNSTAEVMSQHLEGQGLTLLYGEGKRTELSGSLIASSAEAAVDVGFASKRSQPNWKLGLLWLGILSDPTELPLSASILTPEGETETKKIIRSIADELYVAPVDFTYEIGAENVVVTPGIDGSEVDTEALLEAVKEALSRGRHELQVETQPVSGAELTGKALQKLVRVEPKPASVDEEGKLAPAVVGLSVSAEKAQAVLDAAGPEGPYTIPLEFIPPASAEDDSPFYKDLLAQMDGNLESISTLNGKVIQPGEQFSFLDAVGGSGAEAEVMNQGATALYHCAVYSNLSIVERTCGAAVPTSGEAGLDAAVNAPDQDLKFRNTTGFPLKITVSVQGIRFYGSNPDGIRVETQQETKSTTAWTTVYQPDANIRRGTTTESVTPLDGCEVETYRLVYDADGKLLSRTLENTSVYEKRDQVILYNPADSGPWGTAISTPPAVRPTARPNQGPRPTPRPAAPTPQPTPTPTPRPTERPPEASMPSWLQPGAPGTNAPVNTPSTTPTPAPVEPPPRASMPDWLQ